MDRTSSRSTLFDILDSKRQLISSRQSLIDSEAARASSINALYAAIGEPAVGVAAD